MKTLLAIALLAATAVPAAAAPYRLTSAALAATAQPVVHEADSATIPEDPANSDYQAFLAWLDAGNVPDPAPAPTVSSVVSRSAFLALFTAAELTAIATAAQANAGINVWLITAEAQDSINLGDSQTKAGLEAVVAAGLLTGARETAILANQNPG